MLLKWARELMRFWFEASVVAIAITILYLMQLNPWVLFAYLVGLLSGSIALFRLNPAFWLHPPLKYFEFEEELEELPEETTLPIEAIATLHRAPILDATEFVVRRVDGRDQYLQDCTADVVVYAADLQDACIYSDWLSASDAAIHCYAKCDQEYTFVVQAIARAIEVEPEQAKTT